MTSRNTQDLAIEDCADYMMNQCTSRDDYNAMRSREKRPNKVRVTEGKDGKPSPSRTRSVPIRTSTDVPEKEWDPTIFSHETDTTQQATGLINTEYNPALHSNTHPLPPSGNGYPHLQKPYITLTDDEADDEEGVDDLESLNSSQVDLPEHGYSKTTAQIINGYGYNSKLHTWYNRRRMHSRRLRVSANTARTNDEKKMFVPNASR